VGRSRERDRPGPVLLVADKGATVAEVLGPSHRLVAPGPLWLALAALTALVRATTVEVVLGRC
jgi:hypothetical protein